jgi:hypothetical protein
LIPGFAVAADAIVKCGACGAAAGVPCKKLGGGKVHIGRRVKRLLLTAKATREEREVIEEELLELLREELAAKKRKPARRQRS